MTRDIIALVVNAVAQSAQPGLEAAHQHAARFHEGMARAIECAEELRGECDRDYWEVEHAKALGKAAQALQKMPVRWAAILNHTV